jgi:ABC-2 type transport system ATP-binding protein
VFLNSHLLSEVEITCDHVAFIKDGEVIASRDLRDRPTDDIRVVVRAKNLSADTVAGLTPWSTSAALDGERLTFTTHSLEMLPAALGHLVSCGAEVYEFTPARLSLEELFVSIMGEDRGL